MAKPIDDFIAKADLPGASEDAHQAAFFAILTHRARTDPRLHWVFAVPNGGTRDKVSAGIMVATGARRGVWDICIPFPSGQWPLGFIEFKRDVHRTEKNGGLSDKQVEFGKHLLDVKAWNAVVYNYREGLDALDKYLSGKSFY